LACGERIRRESRNRQTGAARPPERVRSSAMKLECPDWRWQLLLSTLIHRSKCGVLLPGKGTVVAGAVPGGTRLTEGHWWKGAASKRQPCRSRTPGHQDSFGFRNASCRCLSPDCRCGEASFATIAPAFLPDLGRAEHRRRARHLHCCAASRNGSGATSAVLPKICRQSADQHWGCASPVSAAAARGAFVPPGASALPD
jgi:hypothetical protein